MSSLDLAGKVVAITGASRGLGAGIATVARRAGASLALCSRGDSAIEASVEVLTAHVDVTDVRAVDRFAADAFERFGHVDLWINNAGLLEPIGPLRELDPSAMHALLDVNVVGVAYGTRAYVRELHARGKSGTLVNISSGASSRPIVGWSMYCTSKAAVDMLTRTVAREEPDLRAFAIAPGIIETNMQEIIRRQSEQDFPDVQRFREYHEKGELQTAEGAAEKLLRFAMDPKTPREPVCVDLR
jgi:benzil reductase ((S)-benzoin forming)